MRIDVLEEFAEMQALASPAVLVLEAGMRQPLASIRNAYRCRNGARGLCRSCPRPVAPGRKSCPIHLHKALLRAYASQERLQ